MIQANRLRAVNWVRVGHWLVVSLMTVGVIMDVAASYIGQLGSGGTVVSLVSHELLWVFVGGLVFFTFRAIDFRRLLQLSRLMLLGALGMLVMVLIPGVGVSVGGASRWFQAGFIQVQPSELIKLALVLFFARLVTQRNQATIIAPVLLLTAISAGLVLIEPDMGTAIVVSAIGMASLFVAQVPLRKLAVLGVVGAGLGTAAAFSSAYRRLRLLSFLNPWRYRSDFAYQEVQALNAFASGRVAGTGLGSGLANWGYLPNAQTDFILAVIGQDLGLIGAVVVVLALAALIWLIFQLSVRVEGEGEKVFLFLFATWILTQTFLNVGAVIGLLPVTGVPLPLISAGGSSTVATLAGFGVASGIARRAGIGRR